MEVYHRDFKGVWIPKEIWLAKNLSIIEKCLLVEIDSLDNDPAKGCFASNAFLSVFIGVSEGRCANIISSLKKRGFIFQVFFDGRNRGLRLTKQLKCENCSHESVKSNLTNSIEPPTHINEHTNTGIKKSNKTKERGNPPPNFLKDESILKGKEKLANPQMIPFVAKSIEDRSLSLKKDLWAISSLAPGKYSKDILRDFFDYWRQPCKDDQEVMLFESEKGWSTAIRLERWYNREWKKKESETSKYNKHSTKVFILGQKHNAHS